MADVILITLNEPVFYHDLETRLDLQYTKLGLGKLLFSHMQTVKVLSHHLSRILLLDYIK